MTKDNSLPNWLKAFLHSFSQVVLVENVLSGLLILLAIFVFAFEAGDWNIGILAVVGAIVGNVAAKLFNNDEDAIAAGLFGFNTVLIGIGAATFFDTQSAYIVTILGSFLAIPLTTVINNLCKGLGLPGFTLPFILTVWFFILVSFQTNLLHSTREAGMAAAAIELGPINWLDALTKGIGEIYLLDSVIASLMILLAFAVDRWQLAIKIAAVILVTIGLGILFEVDTNTLNLGLFTYNSILVLMGMETFSKNKDNPTKFGLLVLLGVVFTVLVDYVAPSILGVYGLPTLTISFVLVTWGLLYLEQHLN